jgi:hypothetical protein
MSMSTIWHVIILPTTYLCLEPILFAISMYLWVSHHKVPTVEICRISHFRIVHSQQNNTLSYIILFTNVITLVFLLPHFSLKFGLKNCHSNTRGVNYREKRDQPEPSQTMDEELSTVDKMYTYRSYLPNTLEYGQVSNNSNYHANQTQ